MSSHDHERVMSSLMKIKISADPADLIKVFGERYNDAWNLIKKRKIKKLLFKPSNRVIWMAEGKNEDYQILPIVGFCMCDDFYFSIIDGKAVACKHLIARKYAEVLNDYKTVKIEDEIYAETMSELRKRHLLTLRMARRVE